MKQFLRRTVTAFLCTISLPVLAQYEGFRHEGEFGIQLGAAHYFGDLNPTTRLNRPKIAGGVFFRKQVNDYVALRIGANFAQLGYSDVYEKDNEFRRRRNLSFNTNIWELMVQGDFNFFRFNPTNPTNGLRPISPLVPGCLDLILMPTWETPNTFYSLWEQKGKARLFTLIARLILPPPLHSLLA